ncbi:MAG: M3 family oligoendopeptidase [Rickettsiales bacterium]
MAKDMDVTAETDVLPQWDLTEFYASPTDPQIKADFDKAEALAKDFAAKYKGKIASLSGDELAQALEEDDVIDRIAHKPLYYASYLTTVDALDEANSKLEQGGSERANEIGQITLFFGLELKNMREEELRAKVAESPALQKYEHVIDQILKTQPYKLSDEIEEFSSYMSPVSASSQMGTLYEKDQARRRYEFRGEELNTTQIRKKLVDQDAEVRKEAAEVFYGGLGQDTLIPVTAMNAIIKEKGLMDAKRGFKTPNSARNLSNDVDDGVVDTMIETVKANYEKTTHRFNRLLAEQLGKESLDVGDRAEGIPGATETYIPWEEAKEIVLESFHEFSPEAAEVAKKFFDEGWIDAQVQPNKRGGAYSSGGHPDMHPMVMVNYTGTPRDVATLAHELGHGVHQYLENENLGSILRGTPLTTAEVASIFAEEVVFDKLLEKVESPTERKVLLANKVSDSLSTITRQVSFADFERKIHDARKDGELSAEDFAEHWTEVRRAEQGDQGELKLDDYKHGWSAIPHMFRSPFYVYAYAFSNLVVNALVETKKTGDIEGFEGKYLDALRAGGTKDYAELLEPFGIDARSPDFWQKGMDSLSERIDQFEQAIEEEKAAQKDEKAAVANDDQPVRVTSAEVVGAENAKTKERGRG